MLFRKCLGLLLATPVVCLATVNQIEYQYGQGSPRSSVQVGNSADQEGRPGSSWSADFLHKAAPYAYLGVGGGRFRSDDNFSGTFVSNAGSTIDSRMSSILALGRLDLSTNPKLVTYAIAGLGWVKNTLSITSVPNGTWSNTGTSEQRTIVDQSKATFGYAAGLGMDYSLTDRLYLGIEARYQGSHRQSFDLTPDGVATTGRTSISVPTSVFMVGLKAGIKY